MCKVQWNYSEKTNTVKTCSFYSENLCSVWASSLVGHKPQPDSQHRLPFPFTPHDLTASSLMPANPNQLRFSFNAGQHLPHSLPSPTVHPALQSAPLHEPQGLFVPLAAAQPLVEPPNQTQSSQLPWCHKSGLLNLMLKSWVKNNTPAILHLNQWIRHCNLRRYSSHSSQWRQSCQQRIRDSWTI